MAKMTPTDMLSSLELTKTNLGLSYRLQPRGPHIPVAAHSGFYRAGCFSAADSSHHFEVLNLFQQIFGGPVSVYSLLLFIMIMLRFSHVLLSMTIHTFQPYNFYHIHLYRQTPII